MKTEVQMNLLPLRDSKRGIPSRGQRDWGVAQLLSVGLQAARKRSRGSFPLGISGPTEVVSSFVLTEESSKVVFTHTW